MGVAFGRVRDVGDGAMAMEWAVAGNGRRKKKKKSDYD